MGRTESSARLQGFIQFSPQVYRAQGETITITRHGAPAAMLVLVGATGKKLTHQEIVEGMRAVRKRTKRDSMTVREMVEEGRRY